MSVISCCSYCKVIHRCRRCDHEFVCLDSSNFFDGINPSVCGVCSGELEEGIDLIHSDDDFDSVKLKHGIEHDDEHVDEDDLDEFGLEVGPYHARPIFES